VVIEFLFDNYIGRLNEKVRPKKSLYDKKKILNNINEGDEGVD